MAEVAQQQQYDTNMMEGQQFGEEGVEGAGEVRSTQ